MSEKITFPSGTYFVKTQKQITESLFNPGGTASGTFKRFSGGIQFYDTQGLPSMFLVDNQHGERFFVSCTKDSKGRTVYFHGLSSVQEKIYGLESYKESREFAQVTASNN